MRCSLVFVLLPLFVVGCSGVQTGEVVENVVPVTGIATYQGKPIEDYTVYFGNDQNRPATGMTDSEGRFTLGTNGSDDGAPVGTHKVWFTYSPTIDVKPGMEQPDARVPPPKVKLPAKYTRKETSEVQVEVPEAGLTDYKLELE